jgi:Tol biopolymer transport system component
MSYKVIVLPLLLLALSIGLVLAAAACQPLFVAPTPTPTATSTLRPTFTPMPTPIAVPSPTPLPTPTPVGGQIAFVSNRSGKWEAHVIDLDAANKLSQLTSDDLPKADAAWSPDGKGLAFAAKQGAFWQVFIEDARTRTVLQLTSTMADNREPTWSPDGSRIAFATNRDGNWEIYAMNADGNYVVNLSQNPAADWHPAWSPDGTRIALTTNRDGNWEIYSMNADGTKPTNLTHNMAGDWYPSWSPDGQRIAFVSDRSNRLEVYSMYADGSDQTNLTRHPSSNSYPTWSPDGRRIAFVSKRDGNFELYVMNADGTHPTRLTDSEADDLYPTWFGRNPPLSPFPASGGGQGWGPAPKDQLGYEPATLWHFPSRPLIDGMRSSLLYTLTQDEQRQIGLTGSIPTFKPGANYPQIYIRDASWMVRVAQYFYPPTVLRNVVEEFLARQYDETTMSEGGDNGIPPGAGAISALITREYFVDKHTNVSDEETSLINAAYVYFKANPDTSWLRHFVAGAPIIARLNEAMEWLFAHRLDQDYGLIVRGDTTDWGDVKRLAGNNPVDFDPATDSRTISLYDQALVYQALNELAEMNDSVGDAQSAVRYRTWAEGIRVKAFQHLWQPDKGFYRTHIHIGADKLKVLHPIDEDKIISITNAVAVFGGMTTPQQDAAIFDNLDRARRSVSASKPGVSLYPPYPSGFFLYPNMGEGIYQNGGLWDWWGGVQVLAEFQRGYSRRALEHLSQVAVDWGRHPMAMAEWQIASTGDLRGSTDYGAGAATMTEAVIEGLYGVTFDRGRVVLSPRLGENDGFIRVYQPASDLYATYEYAYRQTAIVITYRSNTRENILTRVVIPSGRTVTSVKVDAADAQFAMEKLGEDVTCIFLAPPGEHEATIVLAP